MGRVTTMCAALLVTLALMPTAHANTPAEKPWLGVGILKGTRGVHINEVMEATPAEVAGLKVNDQIMKVGGRRVIEPDQLITAVQTFSIGDDVELKVLRGGQTKTIVVTLSAYPTAEELMQRRLLGKPAPKFHLQPVTGKASGNLEDHLGDVVLLELWRISCADCTGLLDKVGDIATSRSGKGLVVLGISSNSVAKQQAFFKKVKVAFTMLHDHGRMVTPGGGYPIGGGLDWPIHIVLDRDGIVVHASTGTDLEPVEVAIDRALRDRNGVALD